MVVVFGWGDARAKDLGEVALTTCPQCHNDVFMHEVHSQKQFSLYFIPITSYGGTEYLLCPICHFGLQLQPAHRAMAYNMRTTTARYRRGLVVAASYRMSVDRFWATVGRNGAGPQILHAPASLGAAAVAPPAQPAPVPTTPILADQLEQLGRLRADGMLTEAEFRKAKRRLLDL